METNQEFRSVVTLPQFPGASVVTRFNTSDDPDQATAETVERMRAAAIEDSSSVPVMLATQEALRRSGGSDRIAQCEAIYKWIASRIQFRHDDPVLSNLIGLDNELDLLIRPARLLTMRQPAEDCDGFTMLACSMLLAAGIPCEIVTIKADHEDPTRYTHVYNQAVMEDGRVLVMDCSQGAQHGYPCGWEAPEYFQRMAWGTITPVQKQEKGMHGLGNCVLDLDGTMICDSGDISSGGGSSPMGTTPAITGSPSGFDLNKFIQQLTAGGLQIAKMQATPVGYVQTPGMTANYGPGGVPVNLGAGIGGISTTTLLIGGGLLAAVLLFGKK